MWVGSFICQRHLFDCDQLTSPLVTTDDAVILRTVASRWNEGNRYGALGYAFFTTLKLDQYRELWHYDSDGNRVCTSLRKRIPFM